MQRLNALVQKIGHPGFWAILSAILLLPPAYFWTFAFLRIIGFDIHIAGDLLERFPEIIGVIIVFVLPFLALLATYITWRLMRNSLTLLMFIVSIVMILACMVVKFFG